MQHAHHTSHARTSVRAAVVPATSIEVASLRVGLSGLLLLALLLL